MYLLRGSGPPVDYIQKSIGDYGLYHLWLCFIVFLSKFPIAWHQMAIIFLTPKVSYTCDGELNKCPCANPEFDKSVFPMTITMKWNLICEKKHLGTLVQTLFQLGTLIGSILFGMASDRWGRRPSFILAIAIQVISGVGAAYMESFLLFNLLRLIVGISVGGTMVVGFVCIMEFCGTKYRPPISALYQVPFNLGHLTLSGFGYYFRNYDAFQVAISAPVAVLLLYYCILPETPRWLMAMKKTEEAIKVCERVAKVNKLPTNTIRGDLVACEKELEKKHLKKGTIVDLFRTPNLRKNILCMAFNWFTCSYCFYGVSQYISFLTGDIFVNVAISATFALFGTFASVPLISVMNRRTMLLLFQAICAICLYALAFLPEGTISVGCACVGNLAAFVVFILVYLYCSELFPTVVRNAALGFSSMTARIGSMIAPFVVGLRDTAVFLPPVIFAIPPTLACIITMFLPETKGCPLMTTLQEGEEFGKKKVTKQPNA
ncbi:unnamed protein product [Arctia plantaginis]|uniref:Major facilitator superfamily (MFS) profile domain-containing protein n=1 Tax=Arctia plantaginis TaxID=874455 RepID=A0A8S0Z296_ARCPL|nr:unnamed protein product [Arctia plantaginis]